MATSSRASLLERAGLILLLSLGGTIGAVAVFAKHLERSKDDVRLTSVAGRQRMLAVALREDVRAAAAGRGGGGRIQAWAREFEAGLAVLERGGDVRGRRTAPVPAGVRPQLALLSAAWSGLRPELDAAGRPRAAPGRAEEGLGAVLERAEGLVAALEARSERLRAAAIRAALAVLALGGLVCLAGLALARRYVVLPIQSVGEAAGRIGAGDFSRRLDDAGVGEVSRLVDAFNDMAGKVRALMDELYAQRRRAETVIAGVPVGLAWLGPDLAVAGVNRSFAGLFDAREDLLAGRPIRELLPWDVLAEPARRALEDGRTSRRLRVELAPPGGFPRTLRVTVTRLGGLQAPGGRGLLLVVEDVTREERADELIGLQAAALEAVADPVCVTERDGAIVSVNEAFCRQNGWTRAELVGRKTSVLKSGRTGEDVYARMWGEILSGRAWSSEIVNRRKDGSLYTALLTVAPVAGAGGRIRHFVSVHHDISARRAMEEKLLQSEKLLATGQLAAGVAHEINNPLGVILGFAQSLARRLPSGDDPMALSVRSIEREALRCRNLVRDLLTFSRASRTEDMAETDLRGAVEEALTLVEARAKLQGVELARELEPAAARVNRNRLQQVVVNLCNNAVDAMPRGGTLRVSLRGGLERVELAVSDTGTGIPEDIRSRVFEPFFTTKPVGRGTGLGLSLAWEIVKKCGGTIDLESEAGRGTTFRVLLPACAPRS